MVFVLQMEEIGNSITLKVQKKLTLKNILKMVEISNYYALSPCIDNDEIFTIE